MTKNATISIFSTQDYRDEARGLKNALASANSRLAQMDTLEADVRARTKELKELQDERRECGETLAKERGRTQHLVRRGVVRVVVRCPSARHICC